MLTNRVGRVDSTSRPGPPREPNLNNLALPPESDSSRWPDELKSAPWRPAGTMRGFRFGRADPAELSWRGFATVDWLDG